MQTQILLLLHSQPQHTVLLGEPRSLQKGDLPLSIEVLLVSTQNDDNVLTGQHSGICQPVGKCIIGLPTETEA